MAKRIIYALVVIGVIGLCFLGYRNWLQRHAMLSGEVLPGQVETPEAVVPPDLPPHKSSPQTISPAPNSQAIPQALASDSMAPNPPNGIAYSGSGRFQVYRQGNLTYRINTDTGQTCVLYATNEEWRKPQVYSHGCGKSIVQ